MSSELIHIIIGLNSCQNIYIDLLGNFEIELDYLQLLAKEFNF